MLNGLNVSSSDIEFSLPLTTFLFSSFIYKPITPSDVLLHVGDGRTYQDCFESLSHEKSLYLFNEVSILFKSWLENFNE